MPLVVNLAPVSCPGADPKTRAEFKRVTPPPGQPDVSVDGKPAFSTGLARAKIDEFRLSEARKNKAGLRAIAELDRCAGVTPPAQMAVK